MTELPLSSPYRDRPDGPVDDAERERLSGRLSAAFAANVIDADEFNRRLDLLWNAQRMGDLVPVVEGLPPAPTHDQPAIVAQSPTGRPGELAPVRAPRSSFVVGGAVVGVTAVLLIILLIILL